MMHTNATRQKTGQLKINRIIAITMLAVGSVSIIASVFYVSSILAFIGLGLTFWGALLLYVTPSKQVSIDLLTATVTSSLENIEKLLADSHLSSRGVYLPPRYLKDFESSLAFIPSSPGQPLPTPEKVDERTLHLRNPEGVFLAPPGLALSKLLEKELGTSFTKTDVNGVLGRLSKLLEDIEIAENTKATIEDKMITIEIKNHIFNELCQETSKLARTHKSVGCPLSSAIACALAKATGKPITIEDEQSLDGRTTRIQYRTLEE